MLELPQLAVYWGNMFCKSFEKKSNIIKEFGKELKGQVTGKLNTGFNALQAFDSSKSISKQMKVPLGAPRIKE
jgi:hypothetical protein